MAGTKVEVMQMLIDGEWCESSGLQTFQVHDPSTGDLIAEVPRGAAEDADFAVAAAHNALPGWRRRSVDERAALQRRLAALIREEATALAQKLNLEVGRPLAGCVTEIHRTAELLDYFADEAERLFASWKPAPGADAYVRHDPVGVVVAIAPFNYPVTLLTMKFGAALVAGCTVVAKPAEDTPLTTLMIAKLALKAGFPAGVLNVVTGFGAEIGDALVRHPSVAKIAFTGGTTVGRRIAVEAADRLKRLTLELGGQSPAIVLADADVNAAAQAIVKHAFSNSGQLCYRVARVLAAAPIAKQLEAAVVREAANLRVGSAHDADTEMGPLIGSRILSSAEAQVGDALAKGARLLTGGQRLAGGTYDLGCYYPPTVLADCTPDMRVMTEESFSPVLAMTSFETVEEAVQLANGTDYGLAAFIFAEDMSTAEDIAADLEAGSIWINDIKRSRHDLPFGGFKLSGIGREKSAYGIEAYLELKSIYLPAASTRG